jgi:hypothetical protein
MYLNDIVLVEYDIDHLINQKQKNLKIIIFEIMRYLKFEILENI